MGRNQWICIMRALTLDHVPGSEHSPPGDHVRYAIVSRPLRISWPPLTSRLVREVFLHFLKLWNLFSIPQTMGYFSEMARSTVRRALSLFCCLALGTWHFFLSFLFTVTFFSVLFSCNCFHQVSQSMGFAVGFGWEFHLCPVLPVWAVT